MLDFFQQYSGALGFFASVVLVIITAFYAHLTRGILIATANQSRLSLSPVIGIKVLGLSVGQTFGPGRRQMSVQLELTNVGNAPAIEVLVDAEIELRYSKVNGESKIPARHEPDVVPFIQPGQVITKAQPNFGNTLVTHFFDDVRESTRLNLHRIETDPSQDAFNTSRLHVFVYYRNSLGQDFKSYYSTEIGIFTTIGDDPIPKPDQSIEVAQIYVPRPVFHAGLNTPTSAANEIDQRDQKRELSGW